MLIRSADFVKSAAGLAGCPEEGLPEIAFAGRSNVGKSTLINLLLGRRQLVRASSTPGRTQLLNFFRINERFFLVDLPGYGYAKAPVSVRRQWEKMVRSYLEQRSELKALVLLLDLRRTPSAQDLELLDWLEAASVPTIPVLTKADKIPRSRRQRQLKVILEATGLDRDAFTFCSALTREGREELWERITVALEPHSSPFEEPR